MEKYSKYKKYMKYISLVGAAIFILLDQLFKQLVITFLADKILTLPIIPDVFHLTYVENTGAAFNIMDGKTAILALITTALIGALIVMVLMNRFKSTFFLWSIALIIGGGIGNLIDRIFRGFVIDYLDFRLINFAVFNFADCCVVIGTAMVFIYILFLDKKQLPENQFLSSTSVNSVDKEIIADIVEDKKVIEVENVTESINKKHHKNIEIIDSTDSTDDDKDGTK